MNQFLHSRFRRERITPASTDSSYMPASSLNPTESTLIQTGRHVLNLRNGGCLHGFRRNAARADTGTSSSPFSIKAGDYSEAGSPPLPYSRPGLRRLLRRTDDRHQLLPLAVTADLYFALLRFHPYSVGPYGCLHFSDMGFSRKNIQILDRPIPPPTV